MILTLLAMFSLNDGLVLLPDSMYVKKLIHFFFHHQTGCCEMSCVISSMLRELIPQGEEDVGKTLINIYSNLICYCSAGILKKIC